MGRIVDIFAVVAVAVVVLLPSGSLVARPALAGNKMDLDRLTAAEDARFLAPDDVEAALRLAHNYLQFEHPDWALQTTAQFKDAGDHRIQLVRATAYAERLEAEAALAEANRGLATCDEEGPARCGSGARVHLNLVAAPMRALVDGHIDPRRDPKGARAAVAATLRATSAKHFLATTPRGP